MVKREVLIFLTLLILFPLVNAGSISISPTNFELFFEPNLEKNYQFTVTNADSNGLIEVYVAGDLANYTTISENNFKGSGKFNLNLKLPSVIEIPGKHRILVGAREGLDKNASSGGVGGIAAVQAVIDVYVRYPGKYLEADFNIDNINKGENAKFELTLNNLGTEKININPVINILDNEKVLLTKEISVGEMQSKEKKIINDVLETSNIKEGIYNASVLINYGKELKINKELKIGFMFVNITDYSYKFIQNKINPFDISVENFWNSEMKNVYAEVVVTDRGRVLTTFKTPSINMNPWQQTNLTGFFDATQINSGKYVANIQVFYGDKINSKLVAVYVSKEINKMLVLGIVAGAVLIAIVVIIIIYLIVQIKKLRKNAKKGKK